MTKIQEQILQNKLDRVLRGQVKHRKIIARFEFGHLHIGTASLHRTVASKRFRMLLKFKQM